MALVTKYFVNISKEGKGDTVLAVHFIVKAVSLTKHQ